MFFQGTIQQGISAAVGQQRLLFCFVTDDNEESKTWETEYLQEESVTDLITTKAVALRLEAGSDEAGYLAQIFPLPKTPTVVIMKHGELKEYIAAGTTREDFFRRVANAFSSGTAAAAAGAAPAPSTPAVVAPAAPTASPAPIAKPTSTASSSVPPAGNTESDGSESVRRVLAERAAKAQRDNAERQAKAAAAAAAASAATVATVTAAKGKGKATAEATAIPVQTEAQKEATDLLKKKKAQQNEERRRILKRIEDDKEARRLQAAQRVKQRQEDQAAEDAQAKEQQEAKATALRGSSSSNSSAAAAIQVRLSDGSTLRNKFPAAGTVKDIRAWVDKDRSDGQGPYFFKQILTPLPNKNIDTTEEGKSIRELGLSPSSTLLVIPIQKFAAAYEGGQAGSSSQGGFGFVGQILALIVGFFTWILSLVGIGGERPPQTQQAEAGQLSPANSPAALRNQRVHAFQNPNDGRGDQQFYNGNSLNFEPRADEDEK